MRERVLSSYEQENTEGDVDEIFVEAMDKPSKMKINTGIENDPITGDILVDDIPEMFSAGEQVIVQDIAEELTEKSDDGGVHTDL